MAKEKSGRTHKPQNDLPARSSGLPLRQQAAKICEHRGPSLRGILQDLVDKHTVLIALATGLLCYHHIGESTWGLLVAGLAGIKQVDSFRQNYFGVSNELSSSQNNAGSDMGMGE